MDTAIRLNHRPLRDGNKTVVALSSVDAIPANDKSPNRTEKGALHRNEEANGGGGDAWVVSEQEDGGRRRLMDEVRRRDRGGKRKPGDKNAKKRGRPPPQGMISYPNFKGQCRFIAYPDIDILYDACDRAEVDCSHIVIHRDAHIVIRSTVLRRHFSEMPVQIKLYTTLLNVIHSQIFDHPKRLASCWDYSVGAEGVNSGDGGGIAAMGRMLGWSEVEFREFYGQIYNVSAPMNDTTKEEIVGDAMRPFMGAMVRASDRVKNSCRKIFDVYHPLTEKKLENASGNQ